MLNIYIALTPYHVLLSLINRNLRNGDSILVLETKPGLFDDIRKMVCQQDFGLNWIFKEVSEKSALNFWMEYSYYCNGFVSSSKVLSQYGILKSEYDKVFVFNDSPIFVQSILLRLKAKKVIYIEDGSAPYNQHFLNKSKFRRILKSVIFGFRYDFINVIGTSRFIDEGNYLYKDLVREENKRIVCRDFEPVENYRNVFDDVCDSLNLRYINSTKSALVLMPLSEVIISDSYNKFYVNAVNALKNSGFQVFIKFHPRENVLIKNKIMRDAHLKEIPSSVPAELIPTLLCGLKIIIGEQSTALLSIKFFDKKSNINLYNVKSNNCVVDEFYNDVLNAIGVRNIESINDILC